MVHLIYIELLYCPRHTVYCPINFIHANLFASSRLASTPPLIAHCLSLYSLLAPLFCMYVLAHTICTQKAVDETFRIILCAETGIF